MVLALSVIRTSFSERKEKKVHSTFENLWISAFSDWRSGIIFTYLENPFLILYIHWCIPSIVHRQRVNERINWTLSFELRVMLAERIVVITPKRFSEIKRRHMRFSDLKSPIMNVFYIFESEKNIYLFGKPFLLPFHHWYYYLNFCFFLWLGILSFILFIKILWLNLSQHTVVNSATATDSSNGLINPFLSYFFTTDNHIYQNIWIIVFIDHMLFSVSLCLLIQLLRLHHSQNWVHRFGALCINAGSSMEFSVNHI